MRAPRWRLPSSDDGLFLPRRRFGGLKKTYGNLAISAHSMSGPRIDDEQSVSRVGGIKRPSEIVSKGELIEKNLTNEGERFPGQGASRDHSAGRMGCKLPAVNDVRSGDHDPKCQRLHDRSHRRIMGILSCIAFIRSSRASQRLGLINMRSFLSSPLVVVGKSPKLTRNRSVGHGLGSAEKSPCSL
jgi:hypothetical protein